MNTDFIKGVIVPIITVIDEEEKINEAAMRAQVDYVINGGLHGILAIPTPVITPTHVSPDGSDEDAESHRGEGRVEEETA